MVGDDVDGGSERRIPKGPFRATRLDQNRSELIMEIVAKKICCTRKSAAQDLDKTFQHLSLIKKRA